MIVRPGLEKYRGGFNVVAYEPDDTLQCSPRLRENEFNEDIDGFYVQRREEFNRLRRDLESGKISPVGFFIRRDHLTVEDTARRMKISARQVRLHMEMKGFLGIDVRTLQRYSEIFDISVADFFQILELEEGLDAAVSDRFGRLLQELKITRLPPAPP